MGVLATNGQDVLRSNDYDGRDRSWTTACTTHVSPGRRCAALGPSRAPVVDKKPAYCPESQADADTHFSSFSGLILWGIAVRRALSSLRERAIRSRHDETPLQLREMPYLDAATSIIPLRIGTSVRR
jgi:hypothetical protein